MENNSLVFSESSPLIASLQPRPYLTRSDEKEGITKFNASVHQDIGKQYQNGDVEIEKKKKKDFKFSHLSRRSKCVLVLCTIAHFLAGCAFSLLAPFYPLIAERKGMSLTLIGLVFSVYQIIMFAFSPIIGNYLTKIGPRFVYLSGIFVGGMSSILFGTLDKCPNGAPFIVMSILCRSVQAFGVAGFGTASFAIVSSEFPDNIGTVFGFLETGIGAGFMVGPAIGGALYDLSGYWLPFFTLGAIFLLNGVLIFNFLPKLSHIPQKRKGSILGLLRSPMIIISMMSVLIAGGGISIYDSTFAKHLEPFGVSKTVTGLFYMIGPSLYALMAPLWGFLVDTKGILAPLIVSGNFVFGLGFMINGPSYFLPFVPFELWTLAIGLTLIGLSLGCCIIPTMTCMVNGAVELGYENNLDTYALVSGLFMFIQSFGAFLGPLAGGAIVQEYGHRVGYTIVAFISFACMCASAIYFSFRYFRREKINIVSVDDNIAGNDEENEYQCKEECLALDKECPDRIISIHDSLSKTLHQSH